MKVTRATAGHSGQLGAGDLERKSWEDETVLSGRCTVESVARVSSFAGGWLPQGFYSGCWGSTRGLFTQNYRLLGVIYIQVDVEWMSLPGEFKKRE